MTDILKKFSKAGSKMFEHVSQSGLKLLIPDVIGSCATRLVSNIDTISDVIARPTNLGLWSCFSRGKLFDRIEELQHRHPFADIQVGYSWDDPLCSPDKTEQYLKQSQTRGLQIENGDHSWGYDLPRSLGQLATSQIMQVAA